MNQKIGFFTRGIAMGIADLIPGISGGTIAFITGIYERLILGIKSLNVVWIFYLLKFLFTGRTSAWHKTRVHFAKIDWFFFIPLALGIALAVFIGAHVISYLLDSYLAQTLSFFVGIIFLSLFFFQKHVEPISQKTRLYFILGSSIGVLLAIAIPTQTPSTWWMYIISGFFGIFALFLPGISGSYILLILGKYSEVLEVLISPFSLLWLLFFFIIGAIAGMYIVSRIVSFLLHIAHDKTLYTLMGIILGSLLLPLSLIFEEFTLQFFFTVFLPFFLLGLVIPFSIHKYVEKKTN
ncbi:MAG: DUF368 domain-containing protein [Candidatus Woesearchaeota archaeon]